jgi:hypothetical protein
MSTEYASIAQICPVRAEISDNIPLILIAKELLDDATVAVQEVDRIKEDASLYLLEESDNVDGEVRRGQHKRKGRRGKIRMMIFLSVFENFIISPRGV